MRLIQEYAQRLARVKTEPALQRFHHWVAEQPPNERKQAVRELNRALGVRGTRYELRRDLPCLTVGSRCGLVVLSANPGWHQKASAEFARHCDGKPENYWRRSVDYFKDTPRCFRSRWWYKAFRYLELLPATGYRYSQHRGAAAWEFAHTSREFGGWELIPIPSSKDGVTLRIEEHPDLRALAEASVKAILALGPRLLLVGQKQACCLVKSHVPGPWSSQALGETGITLWYHQRADSREIVLICRQFISRMGKGLTRDLILDAVRHLRGCWPKGALRTGRQGRPG